MSGTKSGSNIPQRIASILALRNGIHVKNIPDEVLQSVASIKVKSGNSESEWKSVGGGTSSSRNFAWRGWNRPATPTTPQPRAAVPKYVSKFNKSEGDLTEDTINNKIMVKLNGKLNTFSVANYGEIKGFLEQILDSGETAFLKDFMVLVFKKAAAEEIYCPHYARLLAELSKSYTVLNDEMLRLQEKFIHIFEEIEETDMKNENYLAFLERNQQKIYRQGYSQFLAELSRNNVISSVILVSTLNKLLDQICIYGQRSDNNKLVEEYCDCLYKMFRVFEKVEIETELYTLKKNLKDGLLDRIQDILKNSSATFPSMTKKAKFSLMDILEILNA